MRKQRLQFRSDNQMAVRQHGVVERLHAKPVAREKSRLLFFVPQHERKHAAEAIDAILAPRLPRMHDHFGIATGAEYVSECGQFGDQLTIVVDLAIEDHDDRAVLRCTAAAGRSRGR